MPTSYSVLTQPQTVQYSLLHTYAIWYSLLLLGYKPVQHVTVLNTVGNCNTAGSIIILYYYIMGPPSYMRCVVDRNVVMRRMTTNLCVCVCVCVCVCARVRASLWEGVILRVLGGGDCGCRRVTCVPTSALRDNKCTQYSSTTA